MLRNVFTRAAKTLGRWALTPLLRRTWLTRAPHINERPVEFAFAFNCLAELYPAEILDVGSGVSSWPHLLKYCGFHVTAIDRIQDYYIDGFLNRHFYVINDDITQTTLRQQFDAITCISTLEHIPQHDLAITNMSRLLRPDGHLLLSFPFSEARYIENVYKLPGAGYGRDFPFVCQVYSRREVDGWLQRNPNLTIVRQEFYEIFSGEFWTFGQRLKPPRKSSISSKHDLLCLLLQNKPRATLSTPS